MNKDQACKGWKIIKYKRFYEHYYYIWDLFVLHDALHKYCQSDLEHMRSFTHTTSPARL